MSKLLDRLIKKNEVSARIEEARQSQALKLDLAGKSLTELPESVGQLTQLEKLYVHDNHSSFYCW